MNKIKAISYFTLLMLVLFLLGELVIKVCFPHYNSVARYIIPLFYWVLYSVPILAVSSKMSATVTPKFIMAFKAVKIFLSLMLLALLAFAFRAQATGVIINFLFFSFVTLFFETVAMLYIKKRLT